jgi:hypothetical protein
MSNAQNRNTPTNATTNASDGDDLRLFPHARVDIAFTVFSLLVLGLFSLIVVFGMWRRLALVEVNVAGADHDEVVPNESKEERRKRKEERRRKRMEFVLNGLIVKEWVPVDPQEVEESTTGDQDTPPTGEAVKAPQPPAPPINSSIVSCAMGNDDCESLDGEEEMAGCAICLRHFKPQQLVCVSNNLSCQHVFHKDCMIDWLMKDHDNCPMCRESYLLKTV